MRLTCLMALCLGWAAWTIRADDRPTVIVCVGAAGEGTYTEPFHAWAQNWEKASARAGARFIGIGMEVPEGTDDHLRLERALAGEGKTGDNELWLVFIGHGTYDGHDAKFNMHGPDLSAEELVKWLEPIHRPVAVINCASSSSPFLKLLSKSGRVVVTATKSGYEQNYTRFGQFISEAMLGTEADLDKDGQTSLLEAFIAASRKTAEFYDHDGRLATEHALLDDNGDGLGTPADWFRGVRAVKKASDGTGVDGLRAHQFHLIRSDAESKLSPALRTKRNELELAIAQLREHKASMPEAEYFGKLEKLMVQLARLYNESGNSAK